MNGGNVRIIKATDCVVRHAVQGVVRRLSDGKVLPVVAESKGKFWDEIQVVEAFEFWSPSGTVMKPIKMWHPRSRYEPYVRTANPKTGPEGNNGL
jgi:hypothetical protein